MKKDKQLLPSTIDIQAIEQTLPPKKQRSHHELIQIDHVNKYFAVGTSRIHILKHIHMTLYSGEFVIIYGASGCGKSTLLHTILGLEAPTTGTVHLRGRNMYEMNTTERTHLRREKIGMVFQQSNWIKSLSVQENVAYPLHLSGAPYERAMERALQMIEEFGMKEHAYKKPTELSGGQQQRIALARALITDPWIIVADEPTGNLDTAASAEMIRLLALLNREKRRMIVMVTHEIAFLPIGTRRIGMRDGQIVYDEHD